MPVVTRNHFGKGNVYYVGSQLDETGLEKVLTQAVADAGVTPVIPEATQLEVTVRESETTRFYYVMNFTGEAQPLPDSLAGKTDLITGETAKCGDSLKPWDVLLLTEMIH